MQTHPATSQADWFVFQRWAQYEGEIRASRLRIACIAAFYLIHLWRYVAATGVLPAGSFLQISDPAGVSDRFHLLASLLALAWIFVSANVMLVLHHRVFPPWLPWITTGLDSLFLTSLICISAGPRSPLVVGYFLLIALSGLRFSLPLVRCATLTSVAGYLVVLGRAKWPARFGQPEDVDLTVPRYQQVMIVLALVITGVLIGQILRRVRTFVLARESLVP